MTTGLFDPQDPNFKTNIPARLWMHAFERWLASRPSVHTRCAYRKAWQMLVEHSRKMPWELHRGDILDWTEQMQQHGFSRKTIRLRLGSISSFYSQAQPHRPNNPAARICLPQIGIAGHMTLNDRQAFLKAIPRHTLTGKRDYALFMGYLTTGRRTSAIRLIQLKDIVSEPEWGGRATKFLMLPGAGERRVRHTCSPQLWDALQAYLSDCRDVRIGGLFMQPDDFVFTAWSGGISTGLPLSLSSVCHLVKKYARLAGLDPSLTVETLRKNPAI